MSVYDENAIFKDMLLVHEALEEIEEVSSKYLRIAEDRANTSVGKHVKMRDSYRDKEKYYGNSTFGKAAQGAHNLAVKRKNQRDKFAAAARAKEKKESEKRELAKIDPRYMKESFEDIYNSIL